MSGDDSKAFYAGLAPLYHLIYEDWEASAARQAAALDAIIRKTWGDRVRSLLDVSCGIGTQCLGLARMGYDVTASDLSPDLVERAKAEARGLQIAFSVADMREAAAHHGQTFDLVISCDNSVPHLLTDDDILAAFEQFHLCTRPGGGCLISVRDYDKEDLSQPQVKPYGTRNVNGTQWTITQHWEPRGRLYDLTMRFVQDHGEQRTFRSTYYAVGIPRLMELMTKAGFNDVQRLDDAFFQPVITGTKS